MEVNTVPGLVLDESEDEGGEMFGDVKVSQLRFPAKNAKILAKISQKKCKNFANTRRAFTEK